MNEISESLRRELLAMRAEDERTREELARTGELFEGYNPKMEAVHLRNAARLEELIDEYGWLGQSKVGADGAEAAWLVVQHAISLPAFCRRVVQMLKTQTDASEIPRWQIAYLEDRIRFFEGKPQIYGTQFDWNELGKMSPGEIFEPEKIDERRASVGLSIPFSQVVKEHNEAARKSNETAPKDLARRQREFSEWAKRVGWR